ncbi:MAG TPA: DUF4403 domain-containing protein [Gemmatimonas aurantiaca]|uniref:DUF4403 domain-containing protein n=1 Tax=Gemmatimonas aurantiaca TaxID=173480 RepID=A0A3D4V6I2_9BACT|nr:DUF4403 domain-containing protein [Gemmatimonas aurantiaca]
MALLMLASVSCSNNPSAGALPTPGDTSTPASANVPPAPGALAVIPVRVPYVLSALRPSLDSLFPERDSLSEARCANAAGLVCHQYVYRREGLTLNAVDSRLQIDTRLTYRARVGTFGSARVAGCGYAPEPMRRADLQMTTALFWRRDWRIGARDTRLAATLRDPCLVTSLGVNATKTLQNVVDKQLAAFAAQADSAIPVAGDFKPLADSLWRSFLEPTSLDSLGALWLMLDPQAVRVTPFVGAGRNITTTLVLYARPRVVAGSKPRVAMRPLPALALGEGSADFRVPVSVELPYGEMQRRATQLLKDETARQSVKVDSVLLRGAGDSLFVDLGVSGALNGRLTLVSRPTWDAAARELRLDDLDWTLQSRGRLSRIKATLAAPLVSRAVRRATSGGRVPLGAQLDAIRSELLLKLNGTLAPGVVMGSSVRDVQILSVRPTATAIVVQAYLSGQSGVWVQ